MSKDEKQNILKGVILGAGGLLATKIVADHLSKNYINDFLRNCSDFEKNVKNELQKKNILLFKKSTFNDLINECRTNNLLSHSEIKTLKEIRDMRNEVVHGHQEALNKKDAAIYIKNLKILTLKLKR